MNEPKAKLSDILLDDDHEAVLADKQHWEAQTHEATSECYKLVGIIWFDRLCMIDFSGKS